ncbi:MAG: MIP/aquaporin family protein [bacterium]
MITALREHWREYLIEAAGLGLFMISANVFAAFLESTASPVHRALPDPVVRRIIMGVMMGSTAIAIIYSRLGQRSGAHLNPAVTLTFFCLGKVRGLDAILYALSQAAGGIAGSMLAAVVLRDWVGDPLVNFVATVPGAAGVRAAFAAETAIAFGLMFTVLSVSNSARFSRFTGICAGVLVALFITFEAPLSGMSMNPARTLAAAIPSGSWDAFWIYCVAPPFGMLAAAGAYVRMRGRRCVQCAKLHHDNREVCIFVCGWRHRRS